MMGLVPTPTDISVREMLSFSLDPLLHLLRQLSKRGLVGPERTSSEAVAIISHLEPQRGVLPEISMSLSARVSKSQNESARVSKSQQESAKVRMSQQESARVSNS
jgi:hypothetical protein